MLVTELKSIKPGLASWVAYQTIVGRILSIALCPPLEQPLNQSKDLTGVNRRDFVLPNYASEGIWKQLRTEYKAHFVVADAKNSTEVSKEDVLQIGNYLKLSGVGLFAIIVCRGGPTNGAIQTIREQWIMYQKMIVVLNDQDVEQILRPNMQ